MAMSPVQFAKDFARLLSECAQAQHPDTRLGLLLSFWPDMRSVADKPEYQSYIDQYLGTLLPEISKAGLLDFAIEELERLDEIIGHFAAQSPDDAPLIAARKTVVSHMTAGLMYVGEFAAGLRHVQAIDRFDVSDIDIPAEGLSEYDILASVCEAVKPKSRPAFEILDTIRKEWDDIRNNYNADRIFCLLVEKNAAGKTVRGRLRVLECDAKQVETANNESDALTFDNQLKSPDDPFVGVVYDAMKAVRRALAAAEKRQDDRTSCHARFSIIGNSLPLTGDSIGLAAAIVTYAQLLQPKVTRFEKFASAEIAVTGSIDADGNVLPVSEDSLELKITRAFFSPLSYIVVPEQNYKSASECLARLMEKHPARRLRLIAAKHFLDVINDRNIMRDEKICLGQLVGKTVKTYSTKTKIHMAASALIVLLVAYFIAIQIYPKLWIDFDDNPVSARLTDTGMVVFNADSVDLWSKDYPGIQINSQTKFRVCDLDGNGRNEILIVPQTVKSHPCPDNSYLFVYRDNGELLFKRDCVILGQYPGDTSRAHNYSAAFHIFDTDRGKRIVTNATADFPGRNHLKFWSASGDSIGWYINAGSLNFETKTFAYMSGAGYVFTAINNRLSCAVFFVLPETGMLGVSPPYKDKEYNLENVTRGNQKQYVLLPQSDISRYLQNVYNGPESMVIGSDNRIRIATNEEMRTDGAVVLYQLNNAQRVEAVSLDDQFIKYRRQLVAQGILPPMEPDQIASDLFDSIRYWTDWGWVTEKQLRNMPTNLDK